MELYKRSYEASLAILREVAHRLPGSEREAIEKPLLNAATTVPRLIASGGKCDLKEALARCNETIVGLSYCRDLHADRISSYLCRDLIELYESFAAKLEIATGDKDAKRN